MNTNSTTRAPIDGLPSMDPADGATPITGHRFEVAPESVASARRVGVPRALLAQWSIVGLLIVVMLVTVFILPKQAGQNAAGPAPDVPASSPPIAPVPVAVPVPLALTDDPAARLAAQALLQQALDRLAALHTRQAGRWSKTAFHDLETALAEGEKAYREQRYAVAQERYRGVIEQAGQIEAGIPARVAVLLDSGRLALAAGDSAAALAAFDDASILAPDDAAVRAGLRRAGALDQVLALTAQAESYERMQDIDKALAAYREAVLLDSEATAANSALARLEREQRVARFNDAMSAGLEALASADYAASRASFKRAAALDRESPALAAAQLQLEHAELAAAIEHHLTLARRAAAAEQWRVANAEFDAALQRDTTLTDAADGRAIAAERQRIDVALSAHLSRIDRLTDASVHAEATALLAAVRARGLSGKRLASQLAELDTALTQARQPVVVALHSDGETAVSVQKVGEFGRFAERAVELLPGRYVAVGRRDGYRDVRVEFTVAPAAEGATLTVLCNETIPPRP